MKNAGILTIGNEILQGYTLDLNSNHISKELTLRDINVTIQLTVPDEISKIEEKMEFKVPIDLILGNSIGFSAVRISPLNPE